MPEQLQADLVRPHAAPDAFVITPYQVPRALKTTRSSTEDPLDLLPEQSDISNADTDLQLLQMD